MMNKEEKDLLDNENSKFSLKKIDDEKIYFETDINGIHNLAWSLQELADHIREENSIVTFSILKNTTGKNEVELEETRTTEKNYSEAEIASARVKLSNQKFFEKLGCFILILILVFIGIGIRQVVLWIFFDAPTG